MSITKMNFTLDHIVLVLNTYNIKSDITQQNDEIVQSNNIYGNKFNNYNEKKCVQTTLDQYFINQETTIKK